MMVLYTTMTADLLHRGHLVFLDRVRVWGVAAMLVARLLAEPSSLDRRGEVQRFEALASELRAFPENFAEALGGLSLSAHDEQLMKCGGGRLGGVDTCPLGPQVLLEILESPRDLLLLLDIARHFLRRAGEGGRCGGLRVVVGATCDARASTRKRCPVVPFRDRSLVLTNLRSVDRVHPDEGASKLEMYRKLGYDGVFVGRDYEGSSEYTDVFDFAPSPGVVFLDRFRGTSTSSMVEAWQEQFLCCAQSVSVLAHGVAGTIFRFRDRGASSPGPGGLDLVLKTVRLGGREREGFRMTEQELRAAAAGARWDPGSPHALGTEGGFGDSFRDVYGLGHRRGRFPRRWKFSGEGPRGQEGRPAPPCVAGYNGYREVFANLYLMHHERLLVPTKRVGFHSTRASGVARGQVVPARSEVPPCVVANRERAEAVSLVVTIFQAFAGPTFERVCQDIYRQYRALAADSSWRASARDATHAAAPAHLPPQRGSVMALVRCYLGLVEAVHTAVDRLRSHGFVHGDLHQGNVCVPGWETDCGGGERSDPEMDSRNVARLLQEQTCTVRLIDFGWCGHASAFAATEHERKFNNEALEHNFDWLHFVGSLAASEGDALPFLHSSFGVVYHPPSRTAERSLQRHFGDL